MDNENLPPDAPASADTPEGAKTPVWPDPDMMRLIELVERIGGHGEQPL